MTRNLPLKLSSLGLAVMFWLVAEAEEPASRAVDVELALRPPPGRTIVRQPQQVTALLVGPRRELFKLTGSSVILSRMLPDSASDRVELDVEPSDIELPRGVSVHVQDITPRRLVVELDSIYHRTVPVHASVYSSADSEVVTLSGVEVVPSSVRLAGPQQRIEQLDSVRTEPLFLDKLDRLDAAGDQVLRIDTTGLAGVRVRPEMVTIRLNLQPRTDRTIGAVPIQYSTALPDSLRLAQQSVAVTVHGEVPRVASFTADSVIVLLDGRPRSPGAVPLRVVAPTGITARIQPDSVELVPRTSQR
jgi:YbbR domain-containing protein